MVNVVLLAGKILFLLFLYLFIYWVIRASARDMKASLTQAQSGTPGTAPMTVAGPVTVSSGPVVAGGAAAPAATRSTPGAWALVVERAHTRA